MACHANSYSATTRNSARNYSQILTFTEGVENSTPMPISAVPHCIDDQQESHRQGLNKLVLVLWFSLIATCINPSSAETINVDVQRARDGERVSILKSELDRADQALQLLSRQRAERMAASDAKGASEMEAEKRRAEQDKAALIRELDTATRTAASSTPAPTLATAARAPQSRKAATPAPWWDIYGKASPHSVSATPNEPPESASLLTPSTTLR